MVSGIFEWMRRLMGLVVIVSLLVAACGGGDSDSSGASSGGDESAFCEMAIEATGDEDDESSASADFDPLIDVAPSAIRADLVKVRDLFAELEEIERTEDEDAAFAAVLGLGTNPEFVTALENIEKYMIDECGLDPEEGTSQSVDSGSADSGESLALEGECRTIGFVGTASSEGGGDNSPFSLNDSEIVLAQAFALAPGASYTLYLSDYDLGDQRIGSDTIQAAPGQVVITTFVGDPDGNDILLGKSYEVTFVIMDSGSGASGLSDDPNGSVTFLELGDDRICVDIAFTDTGKELRGIINAEVVGGF